MRSPGARGRFPLKVREYVQSRYFYFSGIFLGRSIIKRSSTVPLVPSGVPISDFISIFPPSTTTFVPETLASRSRVISVILETAAILARASPRKPSVVIQLRSSIPVILLVAWGMKAATASSGDIPMPSSVIRILSIPSADAEISIRIE